MDISTQTDQSDFCARGDAQPGRATRCRLRQWQAGVRTHLLWPFLPSPAPAAAAPHPLLLLLLLQFAVPSLMLLTCFCRGWLRQRPRQPRHNLSHTAAPTASRLSTVPPLLAIHVRIRCPHHAAHPPKKEALAKNQHPTTQAHPRAIASRQPAAPQPGFGARAWLSPRPAEPRPFLPCPSLSPSPSFAVSWPG
ncbi:hypothetical protein HDK77DRAFT_177597 [Phyllosticta capitalensis]